MTSSDARLPGFTYLAIMGLLTSIGALATDIMLPALGVLGRDLGVGDINHTTLVVWSSSSAWRLASLSWDPCPMPMAASV